MAEAEQRRRRRGVGCLVAGLIALLLIFVVVAGAVMALSTIGAEGVHFGRHGRGAGEDEMPPMREVWSSGAGTTKVVRIPLSGLIWLDDEGWSRGERGSAASALRAIRRATMDGDVKAILLEVDSPGGGITASDILYQALQDFRDAQEGRVIVTLMGDVAASGGYYVALASDTIMAHPTTLTGSIGVIMHSLNVADLIARIGIKDVTIKSGENKDLLNPLREMSPEQQAMLQNVVDALHRRFVGLVAENRDLPEERVKTLADGRIFLAEQAVDAGLIDAVGYAADAEEAVAELLGDDGLRFHRYEEESSLFDLFRAPTLFGAANLREWSARGGTRLMYSWPF